MVAASEEFQYFRERWRLLPADDQTMSLFIERMLDGQDRMTDAEYVFANSRAAYNVARFKVRRAEGTLIEFQSFDTRPGVPVTMPEMHVPQPPPKGQVTRHPSVSVKSSHVHVSSSGSQNPWATQ